jgi:hypothetical protein
MPAIKRQTMGAVASLHLGSAKKSASTPVPSLTLTFTGIVSDAHGGPTRAAGPREPAFKRGTRLANLRQVSLVSMEELESSPRAWASSDSILAGLRRTSPPKAPGRSPRSRAAPSSAFHLELACTSPISTRRVARRQASSEDTAVSLRNRRRDLSAIRGDGEGWWHSSMLKATSMQEIQWSFCSSSPSLPVDASHFSSRRAPAHRPSGLQAPPKVAGLKDAPSNERVAASMPAWTSRARASFVFHSTPAGMWPLHHVTLSSVARETHVRALAHLYPYLCLVDIEA